VLHYWEPETPLSPAERSRWLAAAERIATGIALLAHLDAFVDAERLRVGFSCAGNTNLAAAYLRAINAERIDARLVTAVASRPADDIVLPCSPTTTGEEITHAVLAVMKASHALEFPVVEEA
jgi:hypothetical protein